MPTYDVDLPIPANDVEAFLEAIRGIGEASNIRLTVEAPTKREAIRDVIEVVQEFAANQGIWLDEDRKDDIRDGMQPQRKRVQR